MGNSQQETLHDDESSEKNVLPARAAMQKPVQILRHSGDRCLFEVCSRCKAGVERAATLAPDQLDSCSLLSFSEELRRHIDVSSNSRC